MSIERLPRSYPCGSTVTIWPYSGTVLLRVGKYHLIWWHTSNFGMA